MNTPICPPCHRVITPSNESRRLNGDGPLCHKECADYVEETQRQAERGDAAYQPWAAPSLKGVGSHEEPAREWLRTHPGSFRVVRVEGVERFELAFRDVRGWPAMVSGATAEEARDAAVELVAAQLQNVEYDARDYVAQANERQCFKCRQRPAMQGDTVCWRCDNVIADGPDREMPDVEERGAA